MMAKQPRYRESIVGQALPYDDPPLIGLLQGEGIGPELIAA